MTGSFLYGPEVGLNNKFKNRMVKIVLQSKLWDCVEPDGPTFSGRNSCRFMVSTFFNTLLVTAIYHGL